MVREGLVLGHRISSAGIKVDRAKTETTSNLHPPTSVRSISSFLGHAGFYLWFIKGFSKIARSITKLLQKDAPLVFSEQFIEAFDLLKDKIVNAPIMIAPDWSLPFELMHDASDYTVGAVLGQRKEKHFHPIYYAIRTLNNALENYTTIEKELLAVIHELEELRDHAYAHSYNYKLKTKELHDRKLIVLMETFVVIGKPQVPCYFIFGDSLFDSGNNNQLLTTLKSNYPPYGTDFPQGVTGRFTNGRTIADIIGQLLGFDEYIPTYATVTDQHINQGVNYASGGSGIREETGSHLGGRISLDRQLLNHHSIVSRLFHLQRNITFTREYLSKCIYLVNMGSNDYINNYLKPKLYTTSHMYTTHQYAKILIRQYSHQLKSLYDLGGRKIVVFGLGLIGCAPEEISTFGTDGKPCVQSINDAIRLFNRKLKPIVDRLNVYHPDAKFTFINLTGMALQQGMVLTNVPSCILRSDGQCAQTTLISPFRTMSMYYDGYHPTEISNIHIAKVSYKAISPMDASPYDISHLARL
ncbi:GDSL esterase/lipase At1g29670-like [Bidens hawaiensis]|uniref:GDSL esterase/lipase At1g29670-like n=1 Tax=Bidens hawaiensis TaxID=980011 RepID=UPI00404ACC4B